MTKTNRRTARPPAGTDGASRRPLWPWPALGAALGLVLILSAFAAFGPRRPPGGEVGRPAEGAARAEVSPASASDEPADAPKVDPEPPPGPAPEGMVWVPGGRFWMGCDDETMADAKPIHLVTVGGFWMDRSEVTNEQFARFVDATGYKTIAERAPDPKDFPGAPKELLVPGSVVFSPPPEPVSLENHLSWWRYVPGADWKHPDGPDSGIEGKQEHPVVQIAWDDAVAYAQWAGKRLPTEAEWEFAARGGLDRKRYCWGDELLPGGKWQVNNWQGLFPSENTKADGFARTAPVESFAPNGYGLYDLAGNVWEWCSDWYRPDYYKQSPSRDPQGPESSHDPNEPGTPKRVQRGGSFLCSDLYCTRYLPGARGKGAPDSGASHVGFRCVKSPEDAR